MMKIILTLSFLLLTLPAFARTVEPVSPEMVLPDAVQESRAQSLGYEIRCVVCQSESINDSQADMARDLRLLVRDKIKAGMSDDEVREFLRSRYGDFILLKPPFQANTLLLWLFPVIAILCGGCIAFAFFRTKKEGHGAVNNPGKAP